MYLHVRKEQNIFRLQPIGDDYLEISVIRVG